MLKWIWDNQYAFGIGSYLLLFLAIFFGIGVLFTLQHKKMSESPQKKLKKANLKLSSTPQGVVFGKLKKKYVCSPAFAEGHIFVGGGSGLGKSSALLIPTLNAFSSEGNFFSIDICGDLAKNVECESCVRFEVGETTEKYNVFYNVDRFPQRKLELIQKIAFSLLPEQTNLNEAGQYYLNNGRNILTASLLAYYDKGYDFIQCCENIYYSGDYRHLFADIDKCNNQYSSNAISRYLTENEKNVGGCYSKCVEAIELFATNERVKASLGRANSFSPATLEEKSIFLCIDDNDLEIFSNLVNLMVTQTFEFLFNRNGKKTILVALDEIASFGKLNQLDASLRKLRKKNVRIMAITQSLPDLDLIYGETMRNSMLNNFAFKCVLSADDSTTQKFWSELVGYEFRNRSSITTSRFANATHTETENRELIIEPASLSNLESELLLIFRGGHAKLQKNYYFK